MAKLGSKAVRPKLRYILTILAPITQMNFPTETDEENSRFLSLAWSLQELMIDLKTPVDIYFILKDTLYKLNDAGYIKITSKPPTEEEEMSLNRFVIFPLINSLCKLWELCSHYGKDINKLPEEIKTPLRKLTRHIEDRRMYDFRNTYTAHIFKKDKQGCRPLTLRESSAALANVMGVTTKDTYYKTDEFRNFMLRIYNKSDKDCAVSVVYATILAIENRIGKLAPRSI